MYNIVLIPKIEQKLKTFHCCIKIALKLCMYCFNAFVVNGNVSYMIRKISLVTEAQSIYGSSSCKMSCPQMIHEIILGLTFISNDYGLYPVLNIRYAYDVTTNLEIKYPSSVFLVSLNKGAAGCQLALFIKHCSHNVVTGKKKRVQCV